MTTASEPVRIASWSGPRNISTAMMRSWGSRSDTTVLDEPFYAYWLHRTGAPHPGRAEVVRAGPTRWQDVVELITGPVPGGHRIWFQKHMTKHLLDEVPLDWMRGFRHVFLIRDPAEVLASFARVQPDVDLDETGLPQQLHLFEQVTATTGRRPPVVDARDVLTAPRAVLSAVCRALDVPFDPAMLSWEPGRRRTDGVWAPYWYAAVERSSGFEPYRPAGEPPAALRPLLARCRPLYDELARHRIRVPDTEEDG